jgi:hypothetical protein
MNKSLEENRRRLFALDVSLRAEADAMLKESGLGVIIREEGFKPVGSYVMRTMAWRDLDFERAVESPDWAQHWELGAKLAVNKWVWSAHAVNEYEDPRHEKEYGYYWGLRAVKAGQKDFWKIDLWTARPAEWESETPKRELWQSLLTDTTRYNILVIKEAVCNLPEYRQVLLSVHIYEAVLEHGVHTIDEFWDWWKNNYGK